MSAAEDELEEEETCLRFYTGASEQGTFWIRWMIYLGRIGAHIVELSP